MTNYLITIIIACLSLIGCENNTNDSNKSKQSKSTYSDYKVPTPDDFKKFSTGLNNYKRSSFYNNPSSEDEKRLKKIVDNSSKISEEDYIGIHKSGICRQAIIKGKQLFHTEENKDKSKKEDGSKEKDTEDLKTIAESHNAALSVLLFSSVGILIGAGYKIYEYNMGIKYEGKKSFSKMSAKGKSLFLGSVILEFGAPLFLATIAGVMLSTSDIIDDKDKDIVKDLVRTGGIVEGSLHILVGLYTAYQAIKSLQEYRSELPKQLAERFNASYLNDLDNLVRTEQQLITFIEKKPSFKNSLKINNADWEKLKKGKLDIETINSIKEKSLTFGFKENMDVNIEDAYQKIHNYSRPKLADNIRNHDFSSYKSYAGYEQGVGGIKEITEKRNRALYDAGIKGVASTAFIGLGVSALLSAQEDSEEISQDELSLSSADHADNNLNAKEKLLENYKRAVKNCL